MRFARPHVVVLAFACAVLATIDRPGVVAANDTTARPNFIVIIADDMACDDCGAYGHPTIRTPNIDRLAKDGMRFDNAFLTCSSCSPSRASILTGRYPHSTGAPELHQPLPVSQMLLTEPLRQAGYFTAAAGKWHLGPAAKPKMDVVYEGGEPNKGGYDHWLPLLRERPKDKPFFFWFASFDPHRPYEAGELDPPHKPSEVVVPPYLADVPETRGDLALYYDEIGRLDLHVGKVVAELAKQGIAENTMILFMSDNGRPFPRCKTTVYDTGVQTPLLVRWPDRVKPGTVVKGLVSSVDIAPTILQLAGLPKPKSFQGVSFVAMLSDPAATIREYVFSEHNWHDYMAWQRSVRSLDYEYIIDARPEQALTPPADAVAGPTFQAMRKLRDEGKLTPEQMQSFVKPRSPEELYDLKTDPREFHNLVDDPNYEQVRDKLREVLRRWQSDTDDVRPETLTPDRFDRETGMPLTETAE